MLHFLLLFPTLTLVVSDSRLQATHDGLRKLTASNFTLTSSGAWLIEFFQPNCGHCRQFGPTWSELSQNKDFLRTQYPQAPFTLAQVNCIAQRDLCNEQGVTFVPRLTVYEDGVQHGGEYTGNRNYAEISAWIDKHADEYRFKKGVKEVAKGPKPIEEAIKHDKEKAQAAKQVIIKVTPPVVQHPPAEPPKKEQPATPAKVNIAVATQDTARPLSPSKALPYDPNPLGQLLVYGLSPSLESPQAFAKFIQKGSGQGPSFVKFFAPWCPHCKSMASAWNQLATSLKGRANVIEVNCEANKGLCNHYSVNGYPTLRMFNDGEMREYNGGRNHDAMLKWATKVGSITGLKTIEAAAELPAIAQTDEVFFLYLHSPGTSDQEIEKVDMAAKVLLGSNAQVYISSDPVLLDRYGSYLSKSTTGNVPSTSGLLVFKDHSALRPLDVFHPALDSEVTRWIAKSQYPLVTELTGSNYHDVIDNNVDALVVIAALSDVRHHGTLYSTEQGTKIRDEELRVVKQLALEWRGEKTRLVVWAWIDADRWSGQLKHLYNMKKDFPHIVLVNGARKEYYPLEWAARSTVFTGIKDALSGATPAKSSLTLIDRGAGAIVNGAGTHPYLAILFIFFVVLAAIVYPGRAPQSGGGTLPIYSKVSTVKAD